MSEQNSLPKLPNGWVWTTLGNIGEVASGGTPSTKDARNFRGDIPWITPADLSGYEGKFISRGQRNISSAGLKASSAKLLPAGTILFSSRAPIGYVAIASAVCATNQGFKNLLVGSDIFNEYVYYFLKNSKELAESFASGTTFREISGARFSLLPIPLAPEPEQHRIVAKIEELLTKLDAGVKELQEAQTQLRRYRQAVLKSAVTGELTKKWRWTHDGDVEPSPELLARILRERRARWEADRLAKMKDATKLPRTDEWKKKYKAPAAPDMNELPDVPPSWTWVTIDQLASFDPRSLTDGPFGSNLKTEHYTEAGPRVIRLQNIGDGIFLDEQAHISPQHFESLSKHQILAGDIAIASLSETAPRSCVIPSSVGAAVVKADCIRFSPNQKLALTEYLNYVLNSEPTRRRTMEVIHGVGRPRLGLGGIRQIALPLPPLLEQQRIVAEVERCLSIADAMEKTIKQSLMQAERMRQSILKKAFEGRLVPQDANDQPANLLLERIKQERVGREAEKRATSKPNPRLAAKKHKRIEGAAA